MEGLVIIRLVALWSLAVNATIPLVQGMTEGTVNTESLKPETVKDAVDLLGKLATETTLKEKFIDALESKVKGYLDVSNDLEKGYKHNVEKLLSDIEKLRSQLLANPADYGRYSTLDEAHLTRAVATADRWLPLLHSEFWFLFFLTTSDGFGIGGSQWSNSYFGSNRSDNNIHKWLTDKFDNKEKIYTVKKGFNNSDLKPDGRVTAQLSGYLGINFYAGGPLNYLQYGIFLLSGDTFLASNLASTMLFLAEFCRNIHKDKFSEKTNDDKYKCLKEVCKELVDTIDALHKHILPLYNPLTIYESECEDEDNIGKVVRRAEGRCNEMYAGKLKIEKFDEYVAYLKDIIPEIYKSLRQLHSDSSDWNVEQISNGMSHGPFKFGYVFSDNKWDSSVYMRLKSPMDILLSDTTTGSLYKLLECLDPAKANTERERLLKPTNPPGRRGGSSQTTTKVEAGDNGPNGMTGKESSGKSTQPTNPQPQPQTDPAPRKGETRVDELVVHGPADSEEGTVTPGEKISKAESKEADEEEEEGEDDDGDDEAASDVEGRTTEENSAKGPTETREGDIPNVQHDVNVPGEANNGNKRLKLARSGEGNEEEGAESLPSATPGTPTSPGRQGNLEGKGDASKAGKHTNESESNTEQRNGGKNAVVPDQRPGSPKTGNRGPVGPQTPHRNEKTPQRRRTHSQGDNAPKAIREEVELPSESSFSGIHACGILIVTCIFSVV